MNKNITDQYQQEITKMLRKPPEIKERKILCDEDQKLFTHLCRLQQEDVLSYQIALELLRKSNTI